jgi:hypothetical protein
MRAKLLLAVFPSLFSLSSSAFGAETFLVNVRALDLYLAPASNSLGSITFQSVATGFSYEFKVTHPDGRTEQNGFVIIGGPSQTWSDVAKAVNVTSSVGAWPIDLPSGQLTLVRGIGNPVGTYQLTGTPIGTVSGQFGAVRFSGIVIFDGRAYSGQLQGQDNLAG